jgi:MFS family permease
MGPLLAAMVLARLPIGINGLATVLFLRAETGSFAVAGAAAGALALGAGVGAPLGARLVDRHGTRLLLVLAGGHAAGLLALVALGTLEAPAGVLVVEALLTGLALPPASSVMRALYPRLLGDQPELVQGAYALDSVVTESIFILGPLITALMVALVRPAAALVVSAGAVAVGVTAFLAALPATERNRVRTSDRGSSRLGALRAPGIRTLVLAMVPVGFALGSLEVALPAFADERGEPEVAGLLIAIWSIGSLAGGLAYGAHTWRAPLAKVHLWVSALLPLGFLPLALAGSPVAMGLLLIPAGVLIAPLVATRNELTGVVAPPGAETEAFTWPLAAAVGGVSLGAAAAGGIVEAGGWRAAVLAATAAGFVGAAVALTRRATLREPAAA